MNLIIQLLFNIYLWSVLIIIFPPLYMISNSINLLVKLVLTRRSKDSYFETIVSKKENSRYMNLRWYSLNNLCLLVVLTPCLLLNKRMSKKLFAPKQNKYRATPNQVASLVISQLVGNIRAISELNKNLNSEYIFALQPTLMDTGAITKDDEAILKMRSSNQTWGFSDIDFFKVYYSRLRDTLKKDKKLRNFF